MASRRLRLLLVSSATIALTAAVVACAAGSAGSPQSAEQPDEVLALQQQVAFQNQRISALETRVASGSAAQPQPKPTAAPTATMVPPVTGITVDGTTRGSPTAKVTITEYIDYL